MASAAEQDESIGFLVKEVYWPFIVSHVRCCHLLLLIPGMAGHPESIRIQRLDRNCQYKEAAEAFLSAMEEQEIPGKWTSFLKALDEMEYEYVASVIRGGADLDSEDVTICKNLISEVFGQTICQVVVISDLMPSLISEGLIDDQSKEELQACENNHGNSEAMMFLLIGHLWRKRKDWYHRFLKVLYSTEHQELVRLIDPNKYEKIKAEVEEKENNAHTAQRELVASGGGPAHQPSPNFSPAPEEPSADERETEMERKASGAPESEAQPDRNLLAEPDEGEATLVIDVKGENRTSEDLTIVKSTHCTEEDDGVHGGEAGTESLNDLTCTSSADADRHAENINQLFNVERKEWPTAQKIVSDAIPQDEPGRCIVYNSDELRSLSDPGCYGEIVKSIPKDILQLCSSCQDEAEGCGEPLEPRKYQLELAELALQGKNIIICAPTNTGKTIVAIKIIQEHLKKPGIHKVAFIVDKVALAGQQFDRCRQYLSPETRIKKMIGEAQESPMPLGSVLQKMDVIIMTAQILVNALKDPESGIRGLQDFTLLIFDECHHTMDNHPYNQVMVRYIDRLKLADPEAPCQPQVVGLTASVGVGKARSQSAALQHIKHLCANMDAVGVVTVRENKEELAKYTNIPPTETLQVPPRVRDEFRNIAEKIMTTIEDSLQISKYFGDLPGTMQSHLKTPPRLNRAEDQYVQWLSMLDKLAAQLDNNDARRFIFACHEQLKVYNSALMLNEDCRTQDAMQFLKNRFEGIKRKASFGESTGEEVRLLEIFDKHCCQLEAANHDTTNPMLDALEEIILETFKEQSDSRAILFVKTRELTAALVQWMEATEELQSLKPAFFTGAQAAADKGGMTQNEQTAVLARFRAGEHRVLVATSVAEEGLDISSCNLVVCYGYNTNVIGMMQIRGRARKTDSKFANVGSARSGLQDKVEVNAMQEILMMQALEELHKLQQQNPATFQENVDRIQKEDHCNRKLKEAHRLEMLQSTEEYELMCCKCGAFVCMSSDIRVIHDCHHVAISEDFMDGAEVKEWSESRVFKFKEVEFKGNVVCRKCGQEWGTMMKYKNFDFPTIKIDNIRYRPSRGIPDKKKHWKQVPFGKIPLTLEDLMMLVERLRGSSSE